jgi:acetolactate synthase regulatory subunit
MSETGARGFYLITDKLRDELIADNTINTVTYGDITQVDLSKQTIFPLAHVMINSVNHLERILSFNITVMTMDVVNQSKDATSDIYVDNDNEQDILNTQLAVINKLVEKLRSGTLHSDKYQLEGNPICEPFVDRFENKIAGWATTFDVIIHNDIYIC